MSKLIFILVMFKLCVFSGFIYAEQEEQLIDIFDRDRGENKESNDSKILKKPPLKKRSLRLKRGTDFYLIGISRYTNQYILHFMDNKRKKEQLIWTDSENISHSGLEYKGYPIIKVKNRKVYFKIKANKQCVENQSHSVSCNMAEKQMIMEVVHNRSKNLPINRKRNQKLSNKINKTNKPRPKK